MFPEIHGNQLAIKSLDICAKYFRVNNKDNKDKDVKNTTLMPFCYVFSQFGTNQQLYTCEMLTIKTQDKRAECF